MIPKIIDILKRESKVGRGGNLKTQNEALWVISNVTSTGTRDQIRYIVSQEVLPLLCKNLSLSTNGRYATLILESIEFILISGEQEQKKPSPFSASSSKDETVCLKTNPYVSLFENCNGLKVLERFLERDFDRNIREIANRMLIRFFNKSNNESLAKNVETDGAFMF